MKFKFKNYFTTKYTKMPAIKRKYGVSKAKSSYPPLKRRSAIRTYSGATQAKLPMSLDHKLLRQEQSATLRYSEQFSVNPGTAGSPGYYCFQSNSCYDPNISGTGHQPRGYDQLAALYQFCAIREVQAELFFTTSDGAPVIVSMSADANPDTVLNAPNQLKMMEARTAVFGQCGGVSGGKTPGRLTMRVKPWQLAGTT
ncbi:hypothetical protein, partial [Rheinheimera sp.]|uniref:hypothetical protein n=1 Tax=Rheinheimera sp. TaxID=1869214 RepID=UPI0040488270